MNMNGQPQVPYCRVTPGVSDKCAKERAWCGRNAYLQEAATQTEIAVLLILTRLAPCLHFDNSAKTSFPLPHVG